MTDQKWLRVYFGIDDEQNSDQIDRSSSTIETANNEEHLEEQSNNNAACVVRWADQDRAFRRTDPMIDDEYQLSVDAMDDRICELKTLMFVFLIWLKSFRSMMLQMIIFLLLS